MNPFRKLFPTSYKLPLFFLLFCCFATAILGDSTAESLFLASFGSQYIPKLFLVNAVFLFFASSLIMAVIDRTDRGKFFLSFLVIHGIVLLAIRMAVYTKVTFLYVPLFSYAYVSKIIVFLLFWTLANDLVDSRKAGKEFPFIAAGGTLGAILIAFAIPSLLHIISAENLLFVWGFGVLGLAALLVPFLKKYGRNFKPVADRRKRSLLNIGTLVEDLKLVRSEPLLWNMALLYFLLFFVIFNQHYGFYSALKLYFAASPNQARSIAGFLGYFNGISMGVTFLLQLSVAGIILRQVGSTRSMYILPIILCVVFGVLTGIGLYVGDTPSAAPALVAMLFWSVVMGVGMRIGFFDSFFSPNFQIFFSSLPQTIRGRGKLAIEGVVKPLAMVSASLWLLLVTNRMPFGMQMGVLFCVTIALLIQTSRLRVTYTQSLTKHLRGFKSKNTQWLSFVDEIPREIVFMDLLKDILSKENHDVQEYVIEILSVVQSRESIDLLLSYLPTVEGRTRATIISALGGLKDTTLSPVFIKHLTDLDERVVANSIEALGRLPLTPDRFALLRSMLMHSSNRIRANTIIALFKSASAPEKDELLSRVHTMLRSDKDTECASGLFVSGEIEVASLITEFETLFIKNPVRIFSTRPLWKQCVAGLSKFPYDNAIDLLLSLSDGSTKKQRNDLAIAFTVLVARGIPVESLVSRLTSTDYVKRNIILRGLYFKTFKWREGVLKIFQTISREELVAIYHDWLAVAALRTVPSTDPIKLLGFVIQEECISVRLDSLIYMAAMLDTSGQVRKIMHRLFHSDKRVRARAVEVLDNSGDFKTNRMVITLLETTDPDAHAKRAHEEFGLQERTLDSVFADYSENGNQWVRHCAQYTREQHSTSIESISHV